MKLRKIIICLSTIGLASGALALVGDRGQVGAAPAVTGAAVYYFCNYYQDKTLTLDPTSATDDKVVMDDAVDVAPNTCHTFSAREGQDTKKLASINIAVSDKGSGSKSTIQLGVTSIQAVLINANVTKKTNALKYSEDNNVILRAYANFNGKYQEIALKDILPTQTIQNLSGGVTPDYVICAAPEAGKCNDTSHRR